VIEVSGADERACTLEELLGADEVFIASTVREVHPVSAVDEQSFDAPGPLTSRLGANVRARIRSELDGA
jgi:branched-chain amino acid aminotransferase